MSQRVPFQGFVGGAFSGRSPRFDTQDLWNWYVERAESQSSKAGQMLLPCPGFELFVDLPTSPVRGLYAQNDRTFAIAGNQFYELTASGSYIARPQTALANPNAPVITNSKLTPAIEAPLVPVVIHTGTTGATTYGYVVTALKKFDDVTTGETSGSPAGTSPYGFASLTSSNYNVISWTDVEGATGYKLYRITGGDPAPPRMIATLASTTLVFNDIGVTGTATAPPTTNTTGQAVGTTTYSYVVTATLGTGESAPSPVGTTTSGPAKLTSTDYNVVTWGPVSNARGYKVYRTVGGVSAPRMIADLWGHDTITYKDIGEEGDAASPPPANTTGALNIFGGTPVNFCSSGDAGDELFFVSGGYGYCFDLTSNVLAPVILGATSGGFIDSYFVALDASESVLKVSESFDGFHWDATQVYQRSRAGDKWLSMAVTSNEIWLIGTQTGEVWTGTGDPDSRFTPYTPVFIETGVIASESMVRVGGASMLWVAQDKDGAGCVVRTSGYTPQKVSTIPVDFSIQNLASIADGYAFSYQQEGHPFYVVTFPHDGTTWALDLLTNEWHRRGYWDPNAMVFKAYRPQCHTFAFGGFGLGLNLVGDRLSGRVAKMSPNYGTDIDGSVIRRVRQCPHITDRDQEMTFDRLQMDMDVGMGLPTGQGSDPTMMLTYSNNGGMTWGSELWRSAGKQGDHRIQVAWSRLGTAKNRVFRLVVSDPVPWRLVGAWLEVEGS